MSSAFLQQLLSRRDTWRGRDLDGAARGGRPTGFAGLDRLLSQGGWPAAAMFAGIKEYCRRQRDCSMTDGE